MKYRLIYLIGTARQKRSDAIVMLPFANSLDPDQAKYRTLTGSKLFDTLMVSLKEFFGEKNDFEKKSADDKKACKITQ